MDQMLGSDQPASQSPYLPMFDEFRKELDEHHDRRERTIKASRDVTAASKKVIFALQRARDIGQSLQSNISTGTNPHHTIIQDRYKTVARDLQGINAWRYARNISSGNQEFIEAACFEHYLATGALLTYDEACDKIRALWGDDPNALLSVDDYLLGIYDTTGELMRFAITCMATNGRLPGVKSNHPVSNEDESTSGTAESVSQRDILTDLRSLRAMLESIDVSKSSWYLQKEVTGKAEVMRTSVEKVERAMYSLVIRGRERPKGWAPDADGSSGAAGRREIDVEN